MHDDVPPEVVPLTPAPHPASPPPWWRNPTWRSLCFEVDSRAVVYFSQLAVLVMVMAFCAHQLTHIDDPVAAQYYAGLLSFTLGVIVPGPQIHQRLPN